MKRIKRFLACVMAAVLVFNVTVFAADTEEVFLKDLTEKEALELSDLETADEAVLGNESGKIPDIKESAEDTDEEVVDTLEEADISEITLLDGPVLIKAEQVSDDGVKIVVSNYNGTSVNAAVWSEKNGQDDLAWYQMKKVSNGNFEYTFDIKQHSGFDLYNIHVYDGNTFVTGCAFKPEKKEQIPAKMVFDAEKTSTGVYLIRLKNYKPSSTLKVAIWSEKNGQDDLVWGNMTASNDAYTFECKASAHKNDEGKYIAHVYDGSTFVTGMLFDVSLNQSQPSTPAGPSIKADKLSDEIYTITLSGYNVTAPRAAIWSEENGQDDLVWSDMKKNGSSYVYDCRLSDHKGTGKYNVHVYDGAKYVAGLSFDVKKTNTAVSSPKITVSQKSDGIYELVLSGYDTSSTPKAAVWSDENGQDDLKWYQLVKSANGSYKYDCHLADHKDYGKYNVHVYDGSKFVSGCAFDVSESAPTALSVTVKNQTVDISVSNIKDVSAIKNIKFAIWSDTNGQDDLKWYDGTVNKSNASATLNTSISSHKDTGIYHVHAYAETASGSVYVAGSRFNVRQTGVTSVGEIKTDYNENGDFAIVIENLNTATDCKKVKVGVWSEEDQSDLVWYTAKADGNGTYSIASNISKHNLNLGTYDYHIYYVDDNNEDKYVEGGQFKIEASAGNIAVGGGEDYTNYMVYLDDIKAPGGLSKITFAVWSEDAGQDDLHWYDGKSMGRGVYGAAIDIGKHKTAGKYNIHAYVYNNGGDRTAVKSTTFNVNVSAKMHVENSLFRDVKGSFASKVIIESSTIPVKEATVAVWCANDKSDITWQKTDASNDFSVSVSAADHFGNTGEYKIEPSVTLKNGIVIKGAQTTYKFNPDSYITISDTDGSGTRKITYVSENVGTPVFYIWSEESGGNDMMEVIPTKGLDGYYFAYVRMECFGGNGKFNVHVYDGECNNFKQDDIPIVTDKETSVKVVKISESVYRIYLFNYDKPENAKVAVWSDKYGMDVDLEWLRFTSDKDKAYAELNLTNHCGYGKYNVHVYSDESKYIAGTSFQAVKDVVAKGFLSGASFTMLDYLEDAVRMASDDTIGYSQYKRMLNPDVDCSSFVYFALYHTDYLGWRNNAFTTYDEGAVLKSAGFTELVYTGACDLLPGDILLRSGHTEIYLDHNRTVGAHSDENHGIAGTTSGDNTGDEVSVTTNSGNWLYVYRKPTLVL